MRLKGLLLGFERKYGIRSGKSSMLPTKAERNRKHEGWVLDFGEWASVYRTWLSRQAQYRNEIQRVQKNAPSLAGLIRVAA